jgi:hypothetical protein
MNINDIARVCHEANRAYCQTIGDYSQATWDSAPQWQKDSAVLGVQHVAENDRDDAPCQPEDSHNSWLAEKRRDGWVYGPVKNPEAKQHPCCVPYEDLPEDQKRKDVLFLAVARALLA